MTHPWDDPSKMTLFHVQLETSDLIVSFEIASEDYDHVDVAKAHLSGLIGEGRHIHCGGTSSIGYVDRGDGSTRIVDFKALHGSLGGDAS